MKHSGKARRAALRLILLTLTVAVVVSVTGLALGRHGAAGSVLASLADILAIVLAILWVLFTLFTCWFFRDPAAKTPDGPGLVVCPGHGKVDAVDKIPESQFPGGPCHRISIFLSVIDIHVQNAPVSGRIAAVTHTAGNSSTRCRPIPRFTTRMCSSVSIPRKRWAKRSACG
jgi:phosphatidylserine decarboxylase precursor-related protein